MSQPLPARSRRQTRRSVRVAERVARVLISIGGIGTIAAVTTILVFLFSVVLPLLRPSRLEPKSELALAESGLLRLGLDEYRLASWTVDEQARLSIHELASQRLLERRALLPEGAQLAAISPAYGATQLALATRANELWLVDIGFSARSVRPEDVGQPALEPGASMPLGSSVLARLADGSLRVQEALVTRAGPFATGASAPIVRIDRTRGSSGERVLFTTEDGGLYAGLVTQREDMLSGETVESLAVQRAATDSIRRRGQPAGLVLLGAGNSALLIWRDGQAERYDLRALDEVQLLETVDLLPATDSELARVGLVFGRGTLLIADRAGGLSSWFLATSAEPSTRDGARLLCSGAFELSGAPVCALAASQRSRLIAVGDQSGLVSVHYASTHELRAKARVEGGAVDALAFAPKEDALLAAAGGRLASFDFDPLHPDASLAALFRPVWYEGYERPAHVWQSSAGTDDFEPKMGLVPLIFGTLKATLYSLLFGVPLALLAALFTSEFLAPALRTPVKSSIEMMASLPSVVLGFLAALILAPFAQHWLPSVLVFFFALPLCFLAGAYAWQFLGARTAVVAAGSPRLVAIFVCVPIAVLLSIWLGPLLERALFAGDAELWLAGQRGGAFPGWLFLLLPVSAFAVVFGGGGLVAPIVRRASASWSRARCASFDLARFAAYSLASALLAALVAWLLTSAGFDARGGLIDTYVQRNALVVGLVMGFAIIPIVYTLSEDALSSVPQHLRLASLGAGATPWQTAVRIVVPTAMSGLFSAVMVGLGRAVGETMVVLMATGNTPVMQWNVFNGFRTLSANIAVEMPEAVRGSSHYRTLFLAALVLFAMTFVLNTIAELVRQRFRRRAYQL